MQAPTEPGGSPPHTRVCVFFLLSFAWSWLCWLLAPVVRPAWPSLATVLMFVGSFGPSLAAVALVAHAGGRAGLRCWLRRCLNWRVGWTCALLAVFLPFALVALAAAMHAALGGSIGPVPAAGHLLMAVANVFLVFALGGPLGEEFGWRGYALPGLHQRFGWRCASLGLGVVWGLWHLPLFYIDGTSQAHIPLAVFLTSVVAMSVLFAWLVQRRAGSIVAALVFHTSINFCPSVVPVLPSEQSFRAYAFMVAMLVVLALLAFVWLPQRPASAVSLRTAAPRS